MACFSLKRLDQRKTFSANINNDIEKVNYNL